MSESELIGENNKLRERVAFLENIVNRGSSGNTSAYNAIRLMIIEKVQKEIEQPENLEDWQKKDDRQRAEREDMEYQDRVYEEMMKGDL